MADIQYAGEYLIEECVICTVGGLQLDVKDLFASVNIYEDIFSNAITGDISLVDTNNILTNASIVGQEKLRLKLVTPMEGATDRTVAVDFTDIPLYIFKINSKTDINDNTVAYNLGFTSYEMIRNSRIRVAQSFSGEPAVDVVKKIVRNDDLLNSKKEFYYEETANNFKVVSPSMRPFDFINAIARRCLSLNYNYAPTFLFYETVKGYFFRSIDNMMDRKNPRMVFKEITPNKIDEDTRTINTAENMTNILKYQVISSTDTLASFRSGMYSSKLVLVDLFNKEVKNYTYNYLDEFSKQTHVDKFNGYGSQQAPVASQARDELNNRISDYPDAVMYIQTTDRDVSDGLMNPAFDGGYDYNGVDQWLMQRKSRIAALNSALTIRLQVPGNTTLQAGDLIGLRMRNQTTTDDLEDPYLSGRYLVRKLRHEFSRGDGLYTHTVHMEVVRDTISRAYPSSGVVCPDGGSALDEVVPLGSEDPGEVMF